jgi:hypothetical protein
MSNIEIKIAASEDVEELGKMHYASSMLHNKNFNQPILYTIEDMIKADIMYNFNPNNSSIVVEGGEVTQLIRTYTP